MAATAVAPTPKQQEKKILPARMYFFIVSDEINPATRYVTRNVHTLNSHAIQRMLANRPMEAMRLMNPEQWGIKPTGTAPCAVSHHTMGYKPSPYTSASNHAFGPPRIEGRTIFINPNKASGVRLIENDSLLADLQRLAATNPDPQFRKRVNYISNKVRQDREVLIEGEIPVTAIKSPAAMGLTRGFQMLGAIAVVLTAYDLYQAGVESERLHSARPISEEAFRQAGGWGAAMATGKAFALAGAAVGIETGPGAVITAAVGGIIGGVIGFYGAEWAAEDRAKRNGLY